MKKKLFLGLLLMIGFCIRTSAQSKETMDMKGMDMSSHKHIAGTSKKTVKTAIKRTAVKKSSLRINGRNTSGRSSNSADMKVNSMSNMKGMEIDTAKGQNDTTSMPDIKDMDMSTPDTGNDTMKTDHSNMSNMDTADMKGMDRKDTSKNGKKEMDHMDHNHMNMDMNKNNPDSHDMNDMDMSGMGSMSHSFSLHLPMSRNGSGTGWLPDASPMYGYMYHSRKWMYMLHGNLFLRYNNQDFTNKGSRGDSKIDAPDWLMFMGQRQVGKNGLFHFSSMFSLDALIGGGAGYPLLFQSGEAYKGKSIVDRQHPHDLFSELSLGYSQALSKKSDVFVYVGYPGEPALGPVAFMHRPSALDNPDAPVSHHWVDATHITFGVATLGYRYGNWKIEGSSFTGKEPDEHRYGFDKPLFNSWSSRLSYNPSQNWALQVSHGFIKSPEALHPGEDINRTTASAVYSLPIEGNNTFNATAVWGLNKVKEHDGENAALIEGSWRKNKLALHTRYEFTQKSTEELSLDERNYGHDAVFPVNAFTIGFNYDLLSIGQTKLAAGSQFTIYHADEKLNSLYGKNPMAVEVYLRLYPGRMNMK